MEYIVRVLPTSSRRPPFFLRKSFPQRPSTGLSHSHFYHIHPFCAGFFVCKLKKLSNDKNVGAIVDDEADDDEALEVDQADFKSHVLEDVQIPKEERRKKGKAKAKGKDAGTAPALVELKEAGKADEAPKKADKVKKPSKIYLEAMAELEAEKAAASGKQKKPEKKATEKKKAKKAKAGAKR